MFMSAVSIRLGLKWGIDEGNAEKHLFRNDVNKNMGSVGSRRESDLSAEIVAIDMQAQ